MHVVHMLCKESNTYLKKNDLSSNQEYVWLEQLIELPFLHVRYVSIQMIAGHKSFWPNKTCVPILNSQHLGSPLYSLHPRALPVRFVEGEGGGWGVLLLLF